MGPKVSTIIPTLNEERYLDKCLASLKNQKDSDNFEIIVVDGGSSDDTVKIAKRFTDNVIISKERSPSIQRNLGAKIAKGGILAFIDADTVASKYWLKGIIGALQDQNVTCATGPLFPLERINRSYIYNLTNILQKILVKVNYPLFWGASCAFRADAFWKIEGFDESLATSEDHDISLRIKKLGKAVFKDDICAFTSHRKFIENEKKAYFSYIRDILEYFFFRRIKTKHQFKKTKINARIPFILDKFYSETSTRN